MNFKDKFKQLIDSKRGYKLNANSQRLDYARGVFTNGTLPANFSITLAAAPCNHSCMFCPQSVEKPAKAEFLGMDLLKKTLKEMPEQNILLNISGYMETLAVPDLVPAIRLMKEIRPNLPIVVASNGSLFREDVIEGLIDAGLDIYQYSFDVPTPEAYSKIIQADHFEKVWNNLERLVEMRNVRNSPMKIQTHIMHFEGIEEDYAKFEEYWKNKVDNVLLRPVSNWGATDLGLRENMAKEGFVPAHQVPDERYPCASIFMHFKLGHDGYYYPCVAAIPAYNHEVVSLGHASETTWFEAWEKLGEMRKAHLAGEWDKYACCRTCNVWSMWDNMWDQRKSEDKMLYSIEGVEYKK
jgi:MoaA/NifB/PqqE/SkfB family radical SAM enzyme